MAAPAIRQAHAEESTTASAIDRTRRSRETLFDDAARFVSSLRTHCQDVVETVSEEMETAPYQTLGAAGGVGFVLGSLLRPGALGAFLDIGARFALATTLSRLQAGSPSAPPSGTPR